MKKNYQLIKTVVALLFLSSYHTFAQVSFTTNTMNGCVPFTVNFTYTGSPSGNYFKWYFGDGDSSQLKNPSHAFIKPNNWNVMLSVWDTTGGNKQYLGAMNNTIQASGVTDFEMSSANVCPGELVNFNFNQGSYNSISWDFGDNTPMDNFCCPSHTFQNAGTYSVKMTINTSSCGTNVVTKQINVSKTAKPVFKINSNQNSACINDALTFNSSYYGSAFIWTFGDGSTSTASNPSHAYTSPGIKKIILSVTNSCGGVGSDTLEINIASSGIMANASFNMNPFEVCPNSAITFSANSAGTYEWDLADGSTSNNQTVSNFYTSAGTYPIQLIVTNGCGDKDTSTQNLVVGGTQSLGFINIGFDSNNGNSDTLSVCPGTKVTFTTYVSFLNGKYSFLWKFGDGTSATGGSTGISHVFTSPGFHKINLTVTNGCGNSDSSVYKYVFVNPNTQPTAQFVVFPDSICPGGKVYFFDGNDKDGGGNSYSINFGDGSSVKNVTGSIDTIVHVLSIHTYGAAGNYPYKFFVQTLCGKLDSAMGTIVVNSKGPKNPPYYVDNSTSNHGGNDNSACPGDAVKLLAIGGALVNWDFGDGQTGSGEVVFHKYNSPGDYQAYAIITSTCGRTDTVGTTVSVSGTNKPQAYFTVNKAFACYGDTIHFTSNSNNNGSDKPNNNTYLWDFGDNTTSTAMNPWHIYTEKGVYNVTLSVTNGCGTNSSNSTSIIIDKPTVKSSGINFFYCNYNAAFALTGTPVGGTFTIDNTLATTFDPGALAVGPHSVKYTYVDINGCSSSDVVPTEIRQAIADAGPDLSVCAGGNVKLEGKGGTSFSWSPPDSLSNASIANPIASPSSTTTYTLVVNSNGCVAADEVTVTVAATLVANAGSNTSVCAGSGVTLSGSGGGNYSWSPSADLSDATVSNPVASPTNSTTYTLTVSSGSCTNTSTVSVTINQTPIVAPVPTDVLCYGTSTGASFAFATGGTPPLAYSWSTNATGITASGLSAGTYTVTVLDSKNCSVESPVTITQPTVLVVTTSVPNNIPCNGMVNGSVLVTTTGGAGGYTYAWSSGATAQTITNIAAGTYTVTVVDANGCSATKSVVVTEPPLLAVTAVAQDLSCKGCSDGTAVALANGGTLPYSYSWTPGGQTGFAINNLGAGSYSACVTDANGCKKCASVTVGDPLTVNSNNKEVGQVSLFPNPNNGLFVLSIAELNSPAEFTITDITGKKVYEKSIRNTKTITETIDLTSFASGVYYAKLITSQGEISLRRLVISK